MTARKKDSIVLLIRCKDRKVIVARVSGFIHDFGGNILDSDHHTDEETNAFLMRMEFATDGLQLPPGDIPAAFEPIAKVYEVHYEVYSSNQRPRVGLMVSKQDHCLADRTVETSCTSTFPSSFRTMTPARAGLSFSIFPIPSIPYHEGNQTAAGATGCNPAEGTSRRARSHGSLYADPQR